MISSLLVIYGPSTWVYIRCSDSKSAIGRPLDYDLHPPQYRGSAGRAFVTPMSSKRAGALFSYQRLERQMLVGQPQAVTGCGYVTVAANVVLQ
jgi:hypothetical protein